MNNLVAQKLVQQEKLKKALKHLDYSYKKILTLPMDIEKLDEEILETWESFAARFARVSDIFLSRYMRTLVLLEDPGFSGTMRDFLNIAEKKGFIDSAKEWLMIRELRNITAHEYSDSDMAVFFMSLKNKCPMLLKLIHKLDS